MSEKVIAMVLAGGKGTRLMALTKKTAKPAVSFAAKYRIIDFPLSNCANSDINVVGVLTQYEGIALDSYIGNGEKWGLNGVRSKMVCLSPRETEEGSNWYLGTADAITENIDFIDSYDPKYILILSGDHIYKTLFNDMIDLHENSGADATISVIQVPWKEASRFGIMNVDKNDWISEFEEKPKEPKSNLASMGIYIFTWKTLREYLLQDKKKKDSEHDFGKNIIPTMLKDKKKLKVYRFNKYWRDVGTLDSLHEANMDIALEKDGPDLYVPHDYSKIFTADTHSVPQYIGKEGSITNSIANQGAIVLGTADQCVISEDAVIESTAVCTRCVIMAGAVVKKGARVNNAIIAPHVVIEKDAQINLDSEKVVLISE